MPTPIDNEERENVKDMPAAPSDYEYVKIVENRTYTAEAEVEHDETTGKYRYVAKLKIDLGEDEFIEGDTVQTFVTATFDGKPVESEVKVTDPVEKKINAPRITHTMTSTEPYTKGTIDSPHYTLRSYLAPTATLPTEYAYATIDKDGNFSFDAPTEWAIGYKDIVWYEAYAEDSEGEIVEAQKTPYEIHEGFYPTEPEVCSNDGTIYINDTQVDFQWHETQSLPEGWSYSGDSHLQWRVIDSEGNEKDEVSIPFDASHGTAIIEATDCPSYEYGDWLYYRVQCTYLDSATNTTYNIGSRSVKYIIDDVRKPVITHRMTIQNPYTKGTCNSGDYTIQAALMRDQTVLESTVVEVEDDGSWTMTPATVEIQEGDYCMYRAVWFDGTHKVESDFISQDVLNYEPASPTISSNNGVIYVNDTEVNFDWTDSQTFPEGWSYHRATFEGRAYKEDGTLLHSVSQEFTPGTGSAHFTIADCPTYTLNQYIQYWIELVVNTDTGEQDTYTSEITTYNINKVKAVTKIHEATGTEQYSTGTATVGCQVYGELRTSVGGYLERKTVDVNEDGTWQINWSRCAEREEETLILYCRWTDPDTGTVLQSDPAVTHIFNSSDGAGESEEQSDEDSTEDEFTLSINLSHVHEGLESIPFKVTRSSEVEGKEITVKLTVNDTDYYETVREDDECVIGLTEALEVGDEIWAIAYVPGDSDQGTPEVDSNAIELTIEAEAEEVGGDEFTLEIMNQLEPNTEYIEFHSSIPSATVYCYVNDTGVYEMPVNDDGDLTITLDQPLAVDDNVVAHAEYTDENGVVKASNSFDVIIASSSRR